MVTGFRSHIAYQLKGSTVRRYTLPLLSDSISVTYILKLSEHREDMPHLLKYHFLPMSPAASQTVHKAVLLLSLPSARLYHCMQNAEGVI